MVTGLSIIHLSVLSVFISYIYVCAVVSVGPFILMVLCVTAFLKACGGLEGG